VIHRVVSKNLSCNSLIHAKRVIFSLIDDPNEGITPHQVKIYPSRFQFVPHQSGEKAYSVWITT